MTCARCKIDYNAKHWGECPHCGAPRPSRSGGPEGVVKTSTILISTEGGGVFRSLEEVPERLRETLTASTNGSNSATIVIADRGGRARMSEALAGGFGEASGHSAQPALPSPRVFWRRPSLFWALLVFALFTAALTWFLASRLP